MQWTRNFINELGNKIRISVSAPDENRDGWLRERVEIEAEGPDSSTSWVLTSQEAEVLAELLEKWRARR